MWLCVQGEALITVQVEFVRGIDCASKCYTSHLSASYLFIYLLAYVFIHVLIHSHRTRVWQLRYFGRESALTHTLCACVRERMRVNVR